MRKKVSSLAVILIILGFGIPASAQENENHESERHYVVNLSLYYPISLNKTEYDSANFNLSLAYSRVGSVQGLDLSLGVSAVLGSVEGLQICTLLGVAGEGGMGMQVSGLLSVAAERFFGFQGSGLLNVAGEDFKGIQAAGLMNVIGHEGMALQAAGMMNVTGERLNGLQASGLFNVVGDQFKGIQLCGLFNVVGDDCYGIQAAGLFSVAGGVLRGLQVGPFNIAGRSEGLQVGACNIGEISRGIQIGIVNYTREENTGLPLGLVNLAENGSIQGVLWGSNLIGPTAGIKFVVNRFYSILSIGALNLNDRISGSLSYGFHYGSWLPLGSFTLRADVGYRYRDNKKLFRSDCFDPDQFVFEGRVLLELPLFRNLSVVIGGGASYLLDTHGDFDTGQWKPLLMGGLEFF